MTLAFKNILIYGRQRSGNNAFVQTINELKLCLNRHGCHVSMEHTTAQTIGETQLATIDFDQLDSSFDLIVVVGGDGSLLNAARSAAAHDIPVVGINRGRLGFLADIVPDQLQATFDDILAGQYTQETRFLLQAAIEHQQQLTPIGVALNDIVLLPGHIAHMIEFAIYVNQQLVCNQRADGLITTTPTGSTAYALSGGGPILQPQLNAIALVPMFPHTLSSRPIVIDGDSNVTITINPDQDTPPHVSYDGHQHIPLVPGDSLHIKKTANPLKLIHPKHYNYYETLRSKLGWQSAT